MGVSMAHGSGAGKHFSHQLRSSATAACWAQKHREKCCRGVISRQCLLSTASRFVWEVCAIRKWSRDTSGRSTPRITLCAEILSLGGAGDMARCDVNNLWSDLAEDPACPGAAEPHPGVPGCFDMSGFTPLQPGC